MRPLLTTLLIVLGIFSANAQINTFKILIKSGSSEIRIGEIVNSLEKGMVLSGDFTLVMEEGAYLGLVHNSGNTLEVRDAGTYSAADLYSRITADKTNILATEYTDFILNRQKREYASGMMEEAYRAFEPFEASEVNLYIPNATELYGDRLALEWSNESELSTIRIMNMFEEVLFEEKVQGQRHIIDLGKSNLDDQDIFMIKVYQQNDLESKAVAIKRIDHESRVLHAANLKELTTNISNSALNELIKAAYFEDNQLLADAFTSYVNAMLIEPDIKEYRDAYNEFLVRHKLLKFAQ